MAKIPKPKQSMPKMSAPKMAANRPGPTPKASAQKAMKMPKATGTVLTPAVETIKNSKKRFML